MNTATRPRQRARRDFPALADTPPDSLRIAIHDTERGPVIKLTGYLDLATAPMLKAACTEVLRDSGDQRVAADVSHLSFCDCTGVDMLLRVHRQARDTDGWLRLCGAGPVLRKMLRITGLASTLRCYASAAEAFTDV